MLDRLDYVVYGKVIDERRTRLVIGRSLRLAYLADYARRLRGNQGLPTTFAESVVPRQDPLAVAAEVTGFRGLIAENAGPCEQNGFEPFHRPAVCAGLPPKSVRLFALFACNNTLALVRRLRQLARKIGQGFDRQRVFPTERNSRDYFRGMNIPLPIED